MRNSAKWFLLLHLILGVYASSSVCSKLAAQQPFLSVGFILPLTTAYANKAITVVWGILLGFLLFGESITLRQFIGAAVIIVGIVLFVRADNEEEGGQ